MAFWGSREATFEGPRTIVQLRLYVSLGEPRVKPKCASGRDGVHIFKCVSPCLAVFVEYARPQGGNPIVCPWGCVLVVPGLSFWGGGQGPLEGTTVSSCFASLGLFGVLRRFVVGSRVAR